MPVPRTRFDRHELEGFLAGTRHALALARRDGRPRPELESVLTEAAGRLARGDLAAAAERVGAVDAVLRGERAESELTEFPRGLIGYVPRGDPGVPRTDEEDPLANRIRLLARLADVAALGASELEAARGELRAAEAALRGGDRAAARRAADAAHRIIEGAARPGPDGARP